MRSKSTEWSVDVRNLLSPLVAACLTLAATSIAFPTSAAAADPNKWCWSMQTGALKGTFTTNVSLPGDGTAAAGTYNLTGFTVYESAFPEIGLGSVADATYRFGSQPEYQVVWDGAQPTGFYRSSGTLTNGFGIENGADERGADISFGINFQKASKGNPYLPDYRLLFSSLVTPSVSPAPSGGLCAGEPSADPGDTTASVPSPTYVDFQFLLPDGRECTAISPARVRVGSMYQLPGADAACRTVPGASVAGWTIPVPHGFTGYGSSAMAFPPGLSVRVVDSQRFTLVPQEPTLRADLDANIAEADSCLQTKTLNTSNRGRVEHVWVPREDIALARFPTSSSCVPAGHVLIGWNTAGDGSGETFAPGAPMPEGWAEDHSNTRHLYAMWVAG